MGAGRREADSSARAESRSVRSARVESRRGSVRSSARAESRRGSVTLNLEIEMES